VAVIPTIIRDDPAAVHTLAEYANTHHPNADPARYRRSAVDRDSPTIR